MFSLKSPLSSRWKRRRVPSSWMISSAKLKSSPKKSRSNAFQDGALCAGSETLGTGRFSGMSAMTRSAMSTSNLVTPRALRVWEGGRERMKFETSWKWRRWWRMKAFKMHFETTGRCLADKRTGGKGGLDRVGIWLKIIVDETTASGEAWGGGSSSTIFSFLARFFSDDSSWVARFFLWDFYVLASSIVATTSSASASWLSRKTTTLLSAGGSGGFPSESRIFNAASSSGCHVLLHSKYQQH